VNKPCALEHEIHAQFAPGQFGRIALRDHADAVAVDHHGVAVDVHIAAEAAVHGVETRQMGIGIGIAQIVDRDDLDLRRACCPSYSARRILRPMRP
jgi:hypothetical protein